MLLPYWNEVDYSHTRYGEQWISKELQGDPRYTERLQNFDRWCRRWIEYYRRKELNAVIKAANEREQQRRKQTRLELREHLTKQFGDDGPDSVKQLRNATFKEVQKPAGNDDFQADWIDDELKHSGLYTPELELVKDWLQLVAIQLAQPSCEKLSESIAAEEALALNSDSDNG